MVTRDADRGTAIVASTLTATTELREKLRKEMDPERNELFFAKHVILVEGDTEKLALPEYAIRMEIDLDRLGCSIVEVGGKRNLKSFADIVISFRIPVTVVFDTDSSDFGKECKADEQAYNEALLGLQSELVRIFGLDPNYESVLRKELGDSEYLRLCQAYPGFSKPIKQRLIAADKSAPIPGFVKMIFGLFNAASVG